MIFRYAQNHNTKNKTSQAHFRYAQLKPRLRNKEKQKNVFLLKNNKFTNNLNTNKMDLGTLTTTVFGIVTPIVTNKKVQKLSKTVWEKVKHWFIIDDKDTEELEDLKNNPNDKDFEDAFLSKLKSKLKKDEKLRKELEQIINEAEKSGDEQTKIIIMYL